MREDMPVLEVEMATVERENPRWTTVAKEMLEDPRRRMSISALVSASSKVVTSTTS
jgi:hypothetical protein